MVAYVRAMIGCQQANRRHARVITEMLLEDEGGTRLKPPGSHDTHARRQTLAALLAAGREADRPRQFDTRAVALAIGGAIDGVIAHWLVHPDLDAAAAELETFTLCVIERPA
ncbi:TetR family transcriptional regulator C-terminal domain-containing protein [Streptomyces pinistramenti]|uniref:TetR family transcriptional regulator C-terminal domain-containing protein n=1 Tax=Streptomyces pinistramenti TaxID=2884812 RepID=UPI001D08B968|nr:TetR family transcriptional regulator C-terminal domain-containing protein [Streptomyces pinistramenti]MCB5909204.1 TetR family transcriptional regulator C-terminal domain-containing protein [Streptomyces pinistramenti]